MLPLLLVYICYLLLGASIFQLLEKEAESNSREQFQVEKLHFLENYTCLDQRALEQFVEVQGTCWSGWAGRGFSPQSQGHDFPPPLCPSTVSCLRASW